MADMRAEAVAMLDREAAEQRAIEDQVQRGSVRSSRRPTGSSVVFSVRLDPDEVMALERRAAERGIAPSVLARNLIRSGLSTRGSARVSRAVDRLEDAIAALRAAVP